MNVNEALDIMGYNSINELTADSLKVKFRKLVKKNHPDLYYSDAALKSQKEAFSKKLNDANCLLSSLIKELNQIERSREENNKLKIIAIIHFNQLIEVYSGNKVILGQKKGGEQGGRIASGTNSTKEGLFELTRRNIRDHNIIINVTCDILVGNTVMTFSKLMPLRIDDEYTIDCIIPVTSLNDQKIIVNAYNKKNITLNLKSHTTKLKLEYQYSVKLTVVIKKKLLAE